MSEGLEPTKQNKFGNLLAETAMWILTIGILLVLIFGISANKDLIIAVVKEMSK